MTDTPGSFSLGGCRAEHGRLGGLGHRAQRVFGLMSASGRGSGRNRSFEEAVPYWGQGSVLNVISLKGND